MTEIGRTLQESDVIGRQIVAIYQSYQLQDDWLDVFDTCFRLDTGLVISMGIAINPCDLTDETKQLIPDDPEVRNQLIGQAIEGVYFDAEAGDDLEDGDLCIKLENGRFLMTVSMAPHGTGGAGMWVNDPDDPPFDSMKRYRFEPEANVN
ncbi:MAG: hypothetical protein KTR15_14990 [Phycisphaeraceae bacterium]|nr:hypothetical protein [Phycisphaeraceae bacterium]